MRWKAEIHYHDGTSVSLEFEYWGDFNQWLLVGPEHDWTVVVNIVITPIVA
jgi:hypothetical protein